jgi:hypothetical protein
MFLGHLFFLNLPRFSGKFQSFFFIAANPNRSPTLKKKKNYKYLRRGDFFLSINEVSEEINDKTKKKNPIPFRSDTLRVYLENNLEIYCSSQTQIPRTKKMKEFRKIKLWNFK